MRLPKTVLLAILTALCGSASAQETPTAAQATSDLYRHAIGEALASAADGNYDQAGNIARTASDDQGITPIEAVHLSTYGTVLYAAAGNVAAARALLDGCMRKTTSQAATVCPRGRAYLDKDPQAARSAVSYMMARWLEAREGKGAPAWVRDKLEAALRRTPEALQ